MKSELTEESILLEYAKNCREVASHWRAIAAKNKLFAPFAELRAVENETEASRITTELMQKHSEKIFAC